MRHLDIQLANLIASEKYQLSVQEGDGVLDLKGWDGVATGPTQNVLLSGNRIQKILTEMIESYSFTGETFDAEDISRWTYEADGYSHIINNGFLDMIVSGSSTGRLQSKFRIDATKDFDLTFKYGGITYNDSRTAVRTYINFWDGSTAVLTMDCIGTTSSQGRVEYKSGGSVVQQFTGSVYPFMYCREQSFRFVKTGNAVEMYKNETLIWSGTYSGGNLLQIVLRVMRGDGSMYGPETVKWNEITGFAHILEEGEF